MFWPDPRRQHGTAVQMQLAILNLIQWFDPGPGPDRFSIATPGRGSGWSYQKRLQMFAQEYGRMARIQLWFDVESVRDI